MSNINFIDAWKDENLDKLLKMSNSSSIIEHINSSEFINSSKDDVVSYLRDVYDKLDKNNNIDAIKPKVKINMAYLSDKIDSLSAGINKVNIMLKEIIDNDDRINESFSNLSNLHRSFNVASDEIRKAVRMLKTKMGYSIITEDEKNRIYQTSEFIKIFEECIKSGGEFEACMTSSLNKFLEERGLI